MIKPLTELGIGNPGIVTAIRGSMVSVRKGEAEIVEVEKL